MNVRVLIDNIVRQTTVLIAQLATAAGLRAPLAHIANQVFVDLVTQLEAEGVSRKVVADMFGLALRTYQMKVQRLSESLTERNTTLWEAVLDYLRKQAAPVSRTVLLERFRRDDEASLGGVLHDLAESGLIHKRGKGQKLAYQALTEADLSGSSDHTQAAMAALVWVVLHRLGRATAAQLAEQLVIDGDTLDAALQTLVRDGRAERVAGSNGTATYQTGTCVVPLEATVGWEAAVFDHYQAMVAAIVRKLDKGEARARRDDRVGGSTYHFDIWPGHPHQAEVESLFQRLRGELSALREEVSAHSEATTPPAGTYTRYTLYLGQLPRDEMSTASASEVSES